MQPPDPDGCTPKTDVQWAGGTHPTGMHTSLSIYLHVLKMDTSYLFLDGEDNFSCICTAFPGVLVWSSISARSPQLCVDRNSDSSVNIKFHFYEKVNRGNVQTLFFQRKSIKIQIKQTIFLTELDKINLPFCRFHWLYRIPSLRLQIYLNRLPSYCWIIVSQSTDCCGDESLVIVFYLT